MKKASLTLCAALMLSACGNLSKVSADGTTDNPIFPKIEKSTFQHNGTQLGSWVNWDNVRQIEKGMNKDQLYNLIGRPHFSEGLYGVREWDYLFNYRENGVHKQCQYKILFDKDMNAQQFYWFPNGCNSDHQFNLSADFLFDFDKSDLKAEGQEVIANLAEQLKALNAKDIVVEGHTDRMGSEQYNLALSQRRAETVSQALIQHGVKGTINMIGLGKSQQVKECVGNDEAAKACLKPNRRVVVKTSGQELHAQNAIMEPGQIGPAPLYDVKYPYSPKITGNPYPAN